jgi:ribonuclease D
MSELIQPIATQEGLNPLLKAIESVPEVYLDTEADSLHHYFEKICLLQFTISSETQPQNFLVDPLANLDLKPLFEFLKSKILIFHGADYDLRMLQLGFSFSPFQIFDTMLGARLAGHTGLGLDALVLKYTGKTLDHASQKADWSRRPLSERLLTYAVEDTRHLPTITKNLREELKNLGRTEWHRQQCAQLIELTGNRKAVEDPWRIKGSFDMDRQKLAILKELWLWRDAEARDTDLPSFRIFNNESLLQWVTWARENPKGDLHNGPKITHRWADRRYRAFKSAIDRGWATPLEDCPSPPPRGKRPAFDPQFSVRMTRLKATRDGIAKRLQLDPSILAPNSMLEAISTRYPRTLEDLSKIERWLPWQTEVLGQAFLDSLQQEQPTQA